jgi:hypothetical protein
MMDGSVKYGQCQGCLKLVKRDDMKSTNIVNYGAGVDKIENMIRIRMCPTCHAEHIERCKVTNHGHSAEWGGVLLEARAIRVSRELSAQCPDIEFDDSETAILDVR